MVGAEHITPEIIDQEPNQENRRVLLELYGFDRYMQSAKVIESNPEGDLIERGEFRAIRVKNSTPEQDGSYKEYLLRVPFWIQTVHDGRAWTFNIHPDDFKLEIET